MVSRSHEWLGPMPSDLRRWIVGLMTVRVPEGWPRRSACSTRTLGRATEERHCVDDRDVDHGTRGDRTAAPGIVPEIGNAGAPRIEIRHDKQGGDRDQPQVIDVTNQASNDPPQATPQSAETVSPN